MFTAAMDLDTIRITEVGPRDGLQNEKKPISSAQKIEFIRKLSKSGLQTIETTSFVKADAIPQLADAKEVSLGLPVTDNHIALVPNSIGYRAALEAGYHKVAVFT
ncbi:MAG: hydroxymethylglutaryl-CoA lyase, partial [Spirochaetota bacterium]